MGPISNSDSSRMGKAVEYLVAASCILQSRDELNVSTTIVDDEGVDLVFHRRDTTATMAVQVKARMSDTNGVRNRSRFQASVRSQTLRPRPNVFVLFVLAEVRRGDIEMFWLVPSADLVAHAPQDSLRRFVFVASTASASKDRWSRYRGSGSGLAAAVLAALPR